MKVKFNVNLYRKILELFEKLDYLKNGLISLNLLMNKFHSNFYPTVLNKKKDEF